MISDEHKLMLAEARGLAESFASALPDRIQAGATSRTTMLPYKALAVRELLLHQVSALATAAVELFDSERTVPAVVLTRAVVEAVAVCYALHDRVERFLVDRSMKDLDAFLVRSLVGARNNSEMPTATNILKFIDQATKTIPQFRSVYDNLCEYTHPNWAGTMDSFGEVDKESLDLNLKLGPNTRTLAFASGVSALSGSLMLFHYYYVSFRQPSTIAIFFGRQAVGEQRGVDPMCCWEVWVLTGDRDFPSGGCCLSGRERTSKALGTFHRQADQRAD